MRKTEKKRQQKTLKSRDKAFQMNTKDFDRLLNGGHSANAAKTAETQVINSYHAANYIHELAIELEKIAVTARLGFLAYLLNMVIKESAFQMKHHPCEQSE